MYIIYVHVGCFVAEMRKSIESNDRFSIQMPFNITTIIDIFLSHAKLGVCIAKTKKELNNKKTFWNVIYVKWYSN